MQFTIKNLSRIEDTGCVVFVFYEASLEQDGHRVYVPGRAQLQPKDPTDPTFVPFSQLTQEQVIGWLEASIPTPTMQMLERQLTRRLAARLNAPKVVEGAPWDPAPEPEVVTEEIPQPAE
jgi:hypothetical protein